MFKGGETDDDELLARMRDLRPRGPEHASLEQRLAVASILDESGLIAEPTRLGRLEVRSKIGGGGMGVVYRAWDPDLERAVAVKLLRGWSDLEERALLAAEARALARLSHPNVVCVYDILDEGGELCVVMEHVAGVTLRAWLAANPEASWREVLAWFVQVERGVEAAHRAGIVHQDLKPENVLVGDDGRARVADFGLARWDIDEHGASLAGGTPHYLAPEVSAGGPATQRSDQYSFCLALGEALEGRGASDAVTTAVERGVRADPEARHASLGALRQVLERALTSAGESQSRSLLLERVERLWLSGVLDRSLEDGPALDLSLRAVPELVESPWEAWGGGADARGPFSSRELVHFLRAGNGSALLVGAPGSGKTMLLLGLCRELWRTAMRQPDEPAPVVLSLSTYEPRARAGRSLSEHFARWVVDELVAKYGLPRPAVTRWIAASSVALLLDGLDETAPELREHVVEALSRFRDEHGLCMVVTCRDTEYEALGSRLRFGGAVAVQPLDDAKVAALVERRHAIHLKAQLERDAELREHLRNPLLLTLLASGTEVGRDVDAPSWTRAYARYVEHAFAATRSRAERESLEARLSFLAQAMRAHNTSDLWLERLTFSWLPRRFEQVAAYVMGVALVFLFGVGLNLAQVPVTGNPLPSALTFGLGVSLSSFAYTRGRIKPVERLRWSWRRMVRLLPVTTLCASLVGLAEGLRINLAANLVGAAITGAILGVAFALEPGERASEVRPNAGVRRSLALALGTSFGFGVPAGVLFGLVLDPYLRRPLIEVADGTGNPGLMGGVSVGLFVFTALLLIYGGFTVLMHYVLRVWLAWRTPLPFDLQGTLDRAVELRLMRRIGGGYVFLHRTLQDYFADTRGQP